MKLVSAPGNKKFSDLAEELLKSKPQATPAETKEALSRLAAANPQLAKTTVLPGGAPVLVPDDLAEGAAELPDPGHAAAFAAVRELQAMIPEIREAVTAAFATGKIQQREFTSALHAAVATEQGVKGAKTASRLKAIGDAASAAQVDAEKNKSLHTHSLSVIARDLDQFLERHGGSPPTPA